MRVRCGRCQTEFDAVEPGRLPERLARLLQGGPGEARPLWVAALLPSICSRAMRVCW